VVLGLFEVVLGGVRTYLFAHTTSRVDVLLGARLFKHLLALPISYFESRPTGQTVARVRELENIRDFLTSSALTLVIDLFFCIVFLAVMYLYSPMLTLIVVMSIPFYALLAVIVTPMLRARIEEKFERGAHNQSFLVESVSGVETLKAMAVQPQMQMRWEESLAAYVKASFRAISLGNWAGQGVQLINKLTTAAVLWFGAHLAIEGKMTVGELVAFNMLAGQVSGPIIRLAQL
jgi:subfamily B ATP-binding cassette protein HlyB/CyaB